MRGKILHQSLISQSPASAKYESLRKMVLANKTMLVFVTLLLLSVLMTAYLLTAPPYKDQHLSAGATQNTYPTSTSPTGAAITPISALTPTILTPAPTLTPTAAPPTPTPTSSPTAHWNTYVNSQYDYTIKYPINWTVTNWGALEPKVPSYIVFNENTSTASARFISVSVSMRTYAEQLAIEGSNPTPITLSGITGSKQNFQDSDGNQSTSVILPRTGDLLMLRTKTPYAAIFNLMLSTLTTTK